MKIIALIISLFSSVAFSATDMNDPAVAFTASLTCAVILQQAADQAEPHLLFAPVPEDDDMNKRYLGVWAEFKTAALSYERAAAVFASKVQKGETEYTGYIGVSEEQMVDEVYRQVAELSEEDRTKYGIACIKGYNIAREREKNEIHL